jgi:glycosyltransferase involved in cell wall biosynthesis
MHILLTVHQFFPEYFSGTEVLTFSVAKELLRRGHQVSVLTGYPARVQMQESERFDSYDLEGMKVYRFKHAYIPLGDQDSISEIEYKNHFVAGYFSHLLKTLRPDIIHFFHLSRLSSTLIDVARQYSIAAFYTPTDFWAVCPTSQLLLDDGNVCAGPTAGGGNCVKHVAILTRWKPYAKTFRFIPIQAIEIAVSIAKSSIPLPRSGYRKEVAALSMRKHFNVSRLNALQAIVSPTKLMTDVLVKNGVNAKLITQSAYGIDITGYEDAKVRDCLSRGVVYGYVGTLAPHKGCHILIEAFTKLPLGSAQLKIYGNPKDFPDYYSSLQNAAKGCESIEFCGTFPNNQIASVLSGIDTLIVPSVWYENTPLVVYSALAAKCPVIASDFPGMSEVVRTDWNGLLFTPGNAKSLLIALERLLADKNLITRLSENCQQPKSTSMYVDELTTMYGDAASAPRESLENALHFSPHLPSSTFGYVTGWAVISNDEPKSVRVLENGKEIGKVNVLSSRQDVSAGLKNSGYSASKSKLGFTVTFLNPCDPTLAVIEVEGRYGTRTVRYEDLKIGEPYDGTKELLIALDNAQFVHSNQK